MPTLNFDESKVQTAIEYLGKAKEQLNQTEGELSAAASKEFCMDSLTREVYRSSLKWALIGSLNCSRPDSRPKCHLQSFSLLIVLLIHRL